MLQTLLELNIHEVLIRTFHFSLQYFWRNWRLWSHSNHKRIWKERKGKRTRQKEIQKFHKLLWEIWSWSWWGIFPCREQFMFQCTVELPVSGHSQCQAQVVPYGGYHLREPKDHIGSKFWLISRDLRHVLNVLFMWKVKIFEKKIQFLPLRNVHLLYYPGMW